MIAELLIDLVMGLAEWLLSLFPSIPEPTWLSNGVANGVQALTSHLAGLGAWVNFAVAYQAGGFIVACLGVGLIIRMVRIIASFLTAGGGSAA